MSSEVEYLKKKDIPIYADFIKEVFDFDINPKAIENLIKKNVSNYSIFRLPMLLTNPSNNFFVYNGVNNEMIEVISDLELTSESSMFTSSNQKEDYMKAMEKQYSDLEYEITDEEVKNDVNKQIITSTMYDKKEDSKNSVIPVTN